MFGSIGSKRKMLEVFQLISVCPGNENSIDFFIFSIAERNLNVPTISFVNLKWAVNTK